MNELALLEGIRVFPNPATDFVTVNGLDKISGSKEAVLSSITGAVIKRIIIGFGELQVSTSTLPAGIYLLRVNTSIGVVNLRFIKVT